MNTKHWYKEFEEIIDGEEWLPLKSFKHYYISNLGRIKKGNKILSQEFDEDLNLVATVKNKKYTVKLRIDRLVIKYFLPNFFKQLKFKHVSTDKLDNTVWNLEWCD